MCFPTSVNAKWWAMSGRINESVRSHLEWSNLLVIFKGCQLGGQRLKLVSLHTRSASLETLAQHLVVIPACVLNPPPEVECILSRSKFIELDIKEEIFQIIYVMLEPSYRWSHFSKKQCSLHTDMCVSKCTHSYSNSSILQAVTLILAVSVAW